VISGLVAAGGLAAALSTADGLLLTISNALVRDIFCHDVRPDLPARAARDLSKFALMGVALVAAGGGDGQAGRDPLAGARPPSRSPPPPSCRPWCWASCGAAPTARARSAACWQGLAGHTLLHERQLRPACARRSASTRASSCGSASSRCRPAVFGVPLGLAVTWA
jgi:hypothetical protein